MTAGFAASLILSPALGAGIELATGSETIVILTVGGAVLYCTVLYCTALYCTVLYCTVLTPVLPPNDW